MSKLGKSLKKINIPFVSIITSGVGSGLILKENPKDSSLYLESALSTSFDFITDSLSGIFQAILFIAAIGGMLIDQFWDPFKVYTQSEINKFKLEYDSQLKSILSDKGLDYPLEFKPSFSLKANSPELLKFKEYVKEYYNDHGLITDIDVFKEENLINKLSLMSRIQNIESNTFYNNQNLYASTQNSINLLYSSMIASKKNISYKNLKKQPFKYTLLWFKYNWQLILCIFIIFISIILLIFKFIKS